MKASSKYTSGSSVTLSGGGGSPASKLTVTNGGGQGGRAGGRLGGTKGGARGGRGGDAGGRPGGGGDGAKRTTLSIVGCATSAAVVIPRKVPSACVEAIVAEMPAAAECATSKSAVMTVAVTTIEPAAIVRVMLSADTPLPHAVARSTR